MGEILYLYMYDLIWMLVAFQSETPDILCKDILYHLGEQYNASGLRWLSQDRRNYIDITSFLRITDLLYYCRAR